MNIKIKNAVYFVFSIWVLCGLFPFSYWGWKFWVTVVGLIILGLFIIEDE